MATDALCWMPATELAARIRTKKVSPVEVIDAVLARIDKLNPRVNAYVVVLGDEARRQAKAAERALTRRSATLGPLHGVPYSVKDLVITKGVRTTFGTPLLRDNVPTEDAPMVARMTAAGGIMLGKTNTPTFGWIGATHNLVYGVTRNPWDLEKTPGASSGGWFDRLAWWQHPRAFFEKYDLLVTPTIACAPFDAAGEGPGAIAGRRVDRYGWIPFTYPFNLTGQPACSVPCGFTRAGLPIGLQIVGRRFDGVTVLRAAAGFERARPWADARPPLV